MSTGVGMSSCCLSGKVHEGTPTGTIETIDNLQTYVAMPKDGGKGKAIVFLVDSMFPRISPDPPSRTPDAGPLMPRNDFVG